MKKQAKLKLVSVKLSRYRKSTSGNACRSGGACPGGGSCGR